MVGAGRRGCAGEGIAHHSQREVDRGSHVVAVLRKGARGVGARGSVFGCVVVRLKVIGRHVQSRVLDQDAAIGRVYNLNVSAAVRIRVWQVACRKGQKG